MSEPTPDSAPDTASYVAEHAPELDADEVDRFLTEHAKPTDEPGTPMEWAVRVLRERREGEHGEGLPVDRVVDEIREIRRRSDG